MTACNASSVIFFLDGFSASAFAALSSSEYLHLNQLVIDGCSGCLGVANPEMGQFNLLKKLFGNISSPQKFGEKFNGLDACLISNVEKATGYASSLDIASKYAVSGDQVQVELFKSLNEENRKLVYVHLDFNLLQSPESGAGLAIFDDCVNKIQQQEKQQVLVALVIGVKNSDIHLTPNVQPVNSLVKNSALVDGDKELNSTDVFEAMIFVEHLSNVTRRDGVTKLSTHQIIREGAYRTLLAHHWIREISFLLGHQPKFGA